MPNTRAIDVIKKVQEKIRSYERKGISILNKDQFYLPETQ